MSNLRPTLTFDYAGHTAEEPLLTAPDGWDEQMVKWVRNKKYYGLFRSFTIPLKFVKDGAFKLRKDFYTYGLDAVATLTVNRLDPINDVYYVAYSGTFDFSTFKDNETYVEINLVDGGLAKIIKDNEAVEYEVYPPSVQVTYWDAVAYTKYFRAGIPIVVLTELVDLMTDGGVSNGTYAVESTLLETTIRDILLMANGYIMRNNSTTGARDWPFKTTFKDFFKSLDAITPIGIGVELRNNVETLVLESRDYFFNIISILAALDNVSEFKLSLYKPFNFSVIKTGYPEKDYDDDAYSVNEFNVEVELLAPNPTSSDNYEIRSKYRADGQGIKQILDNSDGVVWDQDSSDDDIFWIEVREAPTSPGTTELSPGKVRKKDAPAVLYNAWNAWLSPKRSLLRHQLFIESCMFEIINIDLDYTSGGKDQINNETQAIQIGSDWVEEHSGFTINSPVSPGGQYFQPFEIQIEAPYPQNMTSLVEANPRGVIAFLYNDNVYLGYILELEMKLTGRGTQTIKLLSTKTNDLKNLIRQ